MGSSQDQQQPETIHRSELLSGTKNLTRSLGIVLENNKLHIIFDKGTELPRKHSLETTITRDINPRDGGYFVQFPIVELEVNDRDIYQARTWIAVTAKDLTGIVPRGEQGENYNRKLILRESSRPRPMSRVSIKNSMDQSIRQKFQKGIILMKTSNSPSFVLIRWSPKNGMIF